MPTDRRILDEEVRALFRSIARNAAKEAARWALDTDASAWFNEAVQPRRNPMLHYHDGQADFPHGAGASEPGWYVYEQEDLSDEPSGPFPTELAAFEWAASHLSY